MSDLLLIAYKIEKDRGSEDEVGYEICRRAAACFPEVTLITRANNVPALQKDPYFSHVRLIGVDVPRALGWFKKRERGIILYYYLWQMTVGWYARAMQKRERFRIVHQVNFVTDWCPHFLSNPHGKLIWGPIIHHGNLPPDFIFHRRWPSIGREYLRRVAKLWFWYADPFLRPAIRRSDAIIYGNPYLAPAFEKYRQKIRIFPYAGSIFSPRLAEPAANFSLLFVGRLVDLKGCMAALEAFALFSRQAPNASLTFIGGGPLRDRLHRTAEKLGVAQKVTIHPPMPQASLEKHYRQSHLFVFPSVESQGLVVGEALAAGLPVLCLQDTGPAFIAAEAGIAVPQGAYANVVNALAAQMQALQEEWRRGDGSFEKRRLAACARAQAHLTWDAVFDKIRACYD